MAVAIVAKTNITRCIHLRKQRRDAGSRVNSCGKSKRCVLKTKAVVQVFVEGAGEAQPGIIDNPRGNYCGISRSEITRKVLRIDQALGNRLCSREEGFWVALLITVGVASKHLLPVTDDVIDAHVPGSGLVFHAAICIVIVGVSD